jgi:hypothetical protein
MMIMPFEISRSLNMDAQGWVRDAKVKTMNVPKPATISPMKTAINLLAPLLPIFTYPILGIVIRFLAEIQTGIIIAGKIAGITNHVLKSVTVKSKMPRPNNRT